MDRKAGGDCAERIDYPRTIQGLGFILRDVEGQWCQSLMAMSDAPP